MCSRVSNVRLGRRGCQRWDKKKNRWLTAIAGREAKLKIQDEIQKLKYKEPTSPKLVQLEQELVRAEATSLVAEAQLTNVV